MYLDYLKKEITSMTEEITSAQIKKYTAFKNNMLDGISYYEQLFSETPFFKSSANEIQEQLQFHKNQIMGIEIPELVLA
jgi:hypothetical protein